MLIKKCIVCDKKLIKKQKTFCSKKCHYIYQDKREILKCEFCGKEGKWKRRFCSQLCYSKSKKGIVATGGQLLSLKKGWYSHKKKTEEQIKTMRENSCWKGKIGSETAGWRGGRVEIGRSIRNSKKYREWRKTLFERYKFECCMCGNKTKLQTHHIKSFALILTENNIDTIEQAEKCDELWNLDNGQILCVSCHRQTDSHLMNKKGLTF